MCCGKEFHKVGPWLITVKFFYICSTEIWPKIITMSSLIWVKLTILLEHHSHHDRYSRLVSHDQREYITHGTRWASCPTLSNCCCHPHLPLRAFDIHHICWSHHLCHPLPVLHYFYQAPLRQNGLRVEVHVPKGIAYCLCRCDLSWHVSMLSIIKA